MAFIRHTLFWLSGLYQTHFIGAQWPLSDTLYWGSVAFIRHTLLELVLCTTPELQNKIITPSSVPHTKHSKLGAETCSSVGLVTLSFFLFFSWSDSLGLAAITTSGLTPPHPHPNFILMEDSVQVWTETPSPLPFRMVKKGWDFQEEFY